MHIAYYIHVMCYRIPNCESASQKWYERILTDLFWFLFSISSNTIAGTFLLWPLIFLHRFQLELVYWIFLSLLWTRPGSCTYNLSNYLEKVLNYVLLIFHSLALLRLFSYASFLSLSESALIARRWFCNVGRCKYILNKFASLFHLFHCSYYYFQMMTK